MRMIRALLLLILTSAVAFPAVSSAAEQVDLLLVLAADVSRSIDSEKFQLQREGYATAVSDPRVLEAIKSGRAGRIGLSFVEWSGLTSQRIVIDWTAISDAESAKNFADRLLEAPRSFADRTSISGAIEFAMTHLARAPFEIGTPHHRCLRRRHQQFRSRGHASARRGYRPRRHDQRTRHPERDATCMESRSHQSGRRTRELLPQQCDRRPGRLRHGGARLQFVRPSHRQENDRRGGSSQVAAPNARPLSGPLTRSPLHSPGIRSGRPSRQSRSSLLLCGNPLGGGAAKAATKGTQKPVMLAVHLPIRLFDRRKRTLERIP